MTWSRERDQETLRGTRPALAMILNARDVHRRYGESLNIFAVMQAIRAGEAVQLAPQGLLNRDPSAHITLERTNGGYIVRGKLRTCSDCGDCHAVLLNCNCWSARTSLSGFDYIPRF